MSDCGDEHSKAGCGRRALMKCGAAAACAPALAQLAGCAPHEGTPITVDVGAPANGIVTVPLTRVPELLVAGGSLLLRAELDDNLGRPVTILAVNSTTQGLLAYDAYCPHAGCELTWDDGKTQVVCPCHQSRFSADGAVLRAPAQEDLQPHPIKIQRVTQQLSVDLGGAGGIFPAAAADGTVTFTLDLLPALQKVGGSATGGAKGVAFPLLVVRTAASGVAAFDARCTHLGCAVYGAQSLLICKCHGSLFQLDGTVKLGPATAPLRPLRSTFDGTTIVVHTA